MRAIAKLPATKLAAVLLDRNCFVRAENIGTADFFEVAGTDNIGAGGYLFSESRHRL